MPWYKSSLDTYKTSEHNKFLRSLLYKLQKPFHIWMRLIEKLQNHTNMSDSFQMRQEAQVQVVPHLQPVPATTVLGQLHGLHSQCSPHGHVE